MRNSGKIFIWLLVIIIIALIVYVITIGKKEPEVKKNIFSSVNNGGTSNNTNTGQIIISPPATVNDQNFSIGDQIYAASNFLNSYTSCPPTSTNIDTTYSNGDLIGTFLRKQGVCIAVAVKTYPFGYDWIPFSGSKEVYLPQNALVYKK